MDGEFGTIDEYLAGFSGRTRELLEELRAAIRAAAPEATERISYRMPTFFLEGNLVHFAAFKGHIGFYPTPSGIEGFEAELAKYESGKGSVRFPLDEPLPLDLVRRIVLRRVEENLEKAAFRRAKKRNQGR
ncbi:MAG TPA: DUF1801 domain-containing protein [Spirochaetia bacterium]|nr:DUF1801 domain-containing protein [Spirochaetales bacterium]HRY71849.1 DUF1801 domain-containing protein [Spirochaetia bacterium]